MIPKKLTMWAGLAAALLALLLGAVVCVQEARLDAAKADVSRLSLNQAALLQDLDTARAENGRLMASVQTLTFRRDELERLLPAQAAEIRNLRLRLKDVQAVAGIQMETSVQADLKPDTVYVEVFKEAQKGRQSYRFRDAWIDARVTVAGDSAALDLTVWDSLAVVAHRERRRCLFKRPKVTSLTVSPASPYTRIAGVSYIEVTD